MYKHSITYNLHVDLDNNELPEYYLVPTTKGHIFRIA